MPKSDLQSKTVDELDYHKIIAYGETAQPPLNRNRLNWLLKK